MAAAIPHAILAILVAIFLVSAGNTQTREVFPQPALTTVVSGLTASGEPYSFQTEHLIAEA